MGDSLGREIPLTQGKVALVDDSDYEELAKHSWHVQRGDTKGIDIWYAVRNIKSTHTKSGRTCSRMHKVILGTDGDTYTDHINGNGLDNRRSNLRVCTPTQNNRNRRKAPQIRGVACSSKYAGVTWNKQIERWVAQITVDGKYLYLGTHVNEEEAAIAYDMAAIKHFGKFAYPNFPRSS